jgi:hypothetical protein
MKCSPHIALHCLQNRLSSGPKGSENMSRAQIKVVWKDIPVILGKKVDGNVRVTMLLDFLLVT